MRGDQPAKLHNSLRYADGILKIAIIDRRVIIHQIDQGRLGTPFGDGGGGRRRKLL